jgi:arabinan endo-1,5-alpha-L-arabinosidase
VVGISRRAQESTARFSRNGGLQWDPLPSVLPNGLSWWKTLRAGPGGIDVWAPDVKVYNGRTYMYYSVSDLRFRRCHLIGLISASSIAAGDWRDDGLVIRTTNSNDYNAIDPDLPSTPTALRGCRSVRGIPASSSRASAAT